MSGSNFSYQIGRSDNNYQLLGNVNAKNVLGVKQEMSFFVWFIKESGEFSVEGIEIDGIGVR